MKFKYNLSERKLWRIEGDNFYEISEENRFSDPLISWLRNSNLTFKLGEKHSIHFEFPNLVKTKVLYQKPLKSGEFVLYEKEINLQGPEDVMIEFTEEDRYCQGCQAPMSSLPQEEDHQVLKFWDSQNQALLCQRCLKVPKPLFF